MKWMRNYKHSLTKIETSYIVVILNGTNYRFVNYKYGKCMGNSFSVTQKVHYFSIWKRSSKWFTDSIRQEMLHITLQWGSESYHSEERHLFILFI